MEVEFDCAILSGKRRAHWNPVLWLKAMAVIVGIDLSNIPHFSSVLKLSSELQKQTKSYENPNNSRHESMNSFLLGLLGTLLP